LHGQALVRLKARLAEWRDGAGAVETREQI